MKYQVRQVLYTKRQHEQHETANMDNPDPEKCSASTIENVQRQQYSLSQLSLFPQISLQQMAKWKNLKLARQICTNSPKLIYDCSFEHAMSSREIKDTVRQLLYAIKANRSHIDPFLVQLYNLNPSGIMHRGIVKAFPEIEERKMPACLHSTDYCDVFAKEKLVIISNDSPNVLEEFDGDMTYVIGAIVDRSYKMPCMMTKAKQLKIQTARLPFDVHRTFKKRKAIPLNHYLTILLEAKLSGNWDKAFECLSKRLIR